MPPAPLLICLPHGLNVSGVTTWALRLAGALAARGRRAGLIVHREPDDQRRLPTPAPEGVRIFDAGHLPPLAHAGGNLAPFIPFYRDAAAAISAGAGPVVLAPNLLGDCYGIAAALCLTEPERLRVLGWQHSDIAYDARVLTFYEPVITRFVAVSEHIRRRLGQLLPARTSDVALALHGVPLGPAPRRPHAAPGTPLTLLYTGRLEHPQKRIGALVHLSDELHSQGVTHRLTLLGDGPAANEMRAHAAERPGRFLVRPPTGPEGVAALLAEADAFVLASRYEGLSVAMLEAMAAGCVPIVTRVDSGLAEAIATGRTGLIADAGPEADAAAAGVALARAVAQFARSDRRALSAAARDAAATRFGLDAHAERAAALIDEAAAAPPRSWPASRACAFTAPAGSGGSGSGTLGPGAVDRLRALLGGLAGRSLILHGAGRHTIELAHVLAESPARILAIADDDPARAGSTLLGWTISPPQAAALSAAAAGVTDVVISSWMHQDAIFARRAVYERAGLHVHRIYADESAPQPGGPARPG